MAGRYLATELQDDNGDIIYPHTEADIVFASDGTTIEENLSGEVTSEDMQEIFSNTQPQTGKKLSVKEKIKKALKKYQALLEMKILDTVEEVEANTDEGYLMGARAGAELINDLGGCSLKQEGENFYIVGADAVRKKLGSPVFRDYTMSVGLWTGSKTITIPAKHPSYSNTTYVGIVGYTMTNVDIQFPNMTLSGRNMNFSNACNGASITIRYMEV